MPPAPSRSKTRYGPKASPRFVRCSGGCGGRVAIGKGGGDDVDARARGGSSNRDASPGGCWFAMAARRRDDVAANLRQMGGRRRVILCASRRFAANRQQPDKIVVALDTHSSRYRCFLPDLAEFTGVVSPRTKSHIPLAKHPAKTNRHFFTCCWLYRKISWTCGRFALEEREGFEPSVPFDTYDFQSYTFGHSVTSPFARWIG